MKGGYNYLNSTQGNGALGKCCGKGLEMPLGVSQLGTIENI